MFVSATGYLIDSNNLTGYAQVVEEYRNTAAGVTLITYAYGSDLISQAVYAPGASFSETSYFGYDGFGSVRQLTNASGIVTDTWDYDAFGNVINRTGTTDNNYLYRGEQFDADLGMYSLRARFYNQATGRFWNQDTYEGSASDPMSLHKYLYANGNPVFGWDPTGHLSLVETGFVTAGVGTLATIAVPTLRNLGYGDAANRAEGLARAAFSISTMLFIPHPAVLAVASDEAAAGLRQIITGKRELTLVATTVMAAGATRQQAELASAATQVLGAFGPQLTTKAVEAQSFLSAMYTQFVTGRGGAIVIGRASPTLSPSYIQVANQTGANALNVPGWLNKVTDKLPGGFFSWVNRPFIDAALMRGDDIFLSHSTSLATPVRQNGQGFWQELQYLYSRGFRPSGVGSAGERLVVEHRPAI